jgi:hypothetical protein
MATARSIEAKISRLRREIAQIDASFYEANKANDRDLYAGMLERKRDDMVRSAVLQLHTAIEDVLNGLITCRVLGTRPDERSKRTRSRSARALRKLLLRGGSISFEMKLNLAVALHLINSKTQERLIELNGLRNKCSHNWLLKMPVRRGKRPKQKKPPLLFWRGRDLHNVHVLEELAGRIWRPLR